MAMLKSGSIHSIKIYGGWTSMLSIQYNINLWAGPGIWQVTGDYGNFPVTTYTCTNNTETYNNLYNGRLGRPGHHEAERVQDGHNLLLPSPPEKCYHTGFRADFLILSKMIASYGVTGRIFPRRSLIRLSWLIMSGLQESLFKFS